MAIKQHLPGWDSKAISEIAHQVYGGFAKMFAAHNWLETGSDMMRKVQTRVKQAYGSVAAFEAKHLEK